MKHTHDFVLCNKTEIILLSFRVVVGPKYKKMAHSVSADAKRLSRTIFKTDMQTDRRSEFFVLKLIGNL